MKYSIRKGCLLLLGLLGNSQLKAQLSGTINVPNGTYPDLASVVTALNTQGVGTGGVIINVATGNLQTAPSGGYLLGSTALNASVSASKRITINGNGNTISPFTGTGTTDGFFKILGTDFVTFKNFNLQEATTNTTATTQMEWGVALLKLNSTAPFDGCQNDSILNCSITMGAVATTNGIYASHHIVSDATLLAATGATLGDAQNNNVFSGNTISAANNGIFLRGIPTTSFYDRNTVISNNNITFGGIAASAYGLSTKFDSVMTIQGNTFTSPIAQSASEYGVNVDTGKGNLTVNQNSFTLNANATAAMACFAFNNVKWTDSNATFLFTNNRMMNWSVTSVATATCYGLQNNGNTFGALTVTGDTIRDLNVSGALYAFYAGFGGTVNTNVSGNVINNITKGSVGALYLYYVWGTAYGVANVSNNVAKNITAGLPSGTHYGIYPSPTSTTLLMTVKNNKIDNLNLSGAGTFYGYYMATNGAGGGGLNSEISFDTLTNVTHTGSITCMLSNFSNPAVHDNYISGISTNTGSVIGYNNSEGTPKLYNNIFRNFSITGTSGTISGYNFSAGRDTINIYNNTISDFTVANNYSSNAGIAGMYLAGGTQGVPAFIKAYHNTIRFTATSTGANFGAIGINYSATKCSLDLRNNIINVNVTPAGTGYTVAVMRDAGTAGVPPTNFAYTSGGNIYYTPNALKSYVYAENTTLVNAYGSINDPNFNTPCGLYKTFIGGDLTSFIENNLSVGTATGTYIPTGVTKAKKAGVATPIALDYAGITRTVPADAGALQFSGTASDIAGPVINYTPLAVTAYCTAAPTLNATITDASGVNTAAGTAPRLYFRKSTESNTFGIYPANNINSFNGWKYVEATGTAPNFSFVPDYSLLTSAVTLGDSIVYFVVAQDLIATPNVSNNHVAFSSGCPSSVNLSSIGATTALPVANGYKIGALPTFAAIAAPASLCNGDYTTITLSPNTADLSVQWQNDNNTATFANIAGATNAIYTTPALTAANNYKAVLKCANTTVATSTAAVVTVNTPLISGVTPASHCGVGAVTLGATPTTGATINWYTAPTGGMPIANGNTFTTPALGATTTYYAAATSGNTFKAVGKKSSLGNDGSSLTVNGGLIFDAYSPFILQSVNVYPIGTGTGTVTISLLDAAGTTTLQTTTVTLNGTASPGVKTLVPLNWSVPVGTGMKLVYVTKTGNITGLLQDNGLSANVVFPYTIPNVMSITNGTVSNWLKYFFDWSVSVPCESSRLPVTATIQTNGPALTANANQAVCNNAVATLQVTSPLSNFNTYTWTPTANLYTDAAATIPYTGGNASTVYAKTTAQGSITYSANGLNTTSQCTGFDTTKVFVQPATATATVSPDTICINGLVKLRLTPDSVYAPNTIQWESSPTGSAPWTTVSGATTTNFITTTTGSTYYHALVKNTAGATCLQPSDSVVVSNPQLTSAPGVARCGQGIVQLQANGTPGTAFNWYLFPSGGVPVFTGNTYATPTLSTTTTYYVAPTSGSASAFVGELTSNGTSSSNANEGLSFDAIVPFTLKSVYVYPIGTASGTLGIALKNGNTTIQSANVFISGTSQPGVKTLVPLNFNVPVGSGYTLVLGTLTTPGLTLRTHQTNTATYPYTVPGVVSITGNTFNTTQTYNYFYDWQITAGCEGTRVPVVATINPAPAITVAPANAHVCEGDTITMTASSSNNGYSYSWNPGGLTGSTVAVAPTALTAYTITAIDSSTGPNNGCFNTQAVVVNYDAKPTPAITNNNGVLSTGTYNSYQWYLNGQPVAGATNDTYTPTQDGNYTVEVTNVAGCNGVSAQVAMTGLAVNNINAMAKAIRIYPNPAIDMINVESPAPVNIQISSIDGRAVLNRNNARQIDVSKLANGVYMISITNTDGLLLKVEKFVKKD